MKAWRLNLLSELITEKKYALEKMISTDEEMMFWYLVDLGKAGVTTRRLGDKITVNIEGQIVFDLTDEREPKLFFKVNPV